MPLLPCYFFNRFKIDPDLTKSCPKSILEIIKVTGDGHCILHVMREAMGHENIKAIPSNSERLTMIKTSWTTMGNLFTALMLILYTN